MIAGKISYMAIAGTPRIHSGIDLFISKACEIGGITYSELMSKKRNRNIVDIRHILANHMISRFKLTTHKAGALLGIDHEEKQRNDSTYVNKHEVIECIKRHFNIVNDSLPNRNNGEQNIIGNFVTVLESELKKEIKQLKEVKI